jgi:hypothetical protein
MALRAFVLLPALLLEDYDLVSLAVAYDLSFDSAGGSARAGKQRVDVYRRAYLSIYGRNANCLAALDRELLAACFNDRITHVRSLVEGTRAATNRKIQILQKWMSGVKERPASAGHLCL